MPVIRWQADTSTHFSSLAVDGGNIVLVLGEPLTHILTERPNELQARGVVVVKWKLCHTLVELGGVVHPF